MNNMIKEKMKKELIFVAHTVLGVLYTPIFLIGVILNILSRMVLGASYFMLLNKQYGIDVLKGLKKLITS